ncbi:MAG: telomerase protein component 1 [Chthoniobacter sp.]|nr:telomerase protein component 1 [Chthoniobacter sp.]
MFISSTFRDMQAERDWLVRFVFPRLREELLKQRIHLVDVDLRWGVASDRDALGVCRQIIDECRPRFLCMLGGRYGWVAPGREHSITADEVRYGVLDRLGEHGFAFFYFRDPQATAEIVGETAGEYHEPTGSEAARQLDALKQAVLDAGLEPFIYPARWDAPQRRIAGLEAFGERVYADLLASVRNDPEFAGRFLEETPRHERERVDLDAREFTEAADAVEVFIEERVERFVIGSRQPLLAALTAFADAAGGPNLFLIEGAPGSGKSALLGKLHQSLASAPPITDHHLPITQPLLLPHFIGASAGSTDLRRTLRRLCHAMAQAASSSEPLAEDTRDLIEQFKRLLGEASARQRVVLILDALNQLDPTDSAHSMHWLPWDLPPNVRIVASSLPHQTLEALRVRGERVRIQGLAPLTETDAQAIIAGFLERHRKRMSPEQIAALLAKPESRLPLYVLTALEELRTLGTYEEITARIRELPGQTHALFRWILTERLARDPGFRDRKGRPTGASLVARFAACLGASRHGLAPGELSALLDPGDPLGNVAALLRLLRPYLMRRGELLDFFHGQFRSAAEAEYLDTAAKRLGAHRALADYFRVQGDSAGDGSWTGNSRRALSELPYHQTHAEAWPELVATLENIFFLEGKAVHGMVFDLALDFAAAGEHLPADHPQHRILRLLEEALRRDIHFIARHATDYPQALFQCLWNSCWWFEHREGARHYEAGKAPSGGMVRLPPTKSPSLTPPTGDPRLSRLLERWKGQREQTTPGFPWLRSHRPPSVHLSTGQLVVLHGHGSDVRSVCYSPDGRRIISGAGDRTVRIWDADTGAELAVLRGHKGGVLSVSYSPNGRFIVSGGGDNLTGDHDTTVRVWDADSGEQSAVLRGHEDWVWSVGCSPDGRRIVSGADDLTVRVWDAISGVQLAVLCGHEKGVSSVSYSPDGQRIVSGSGDGTVRVWDANSWDQLAVLRGHKYGVSSVSYSPDGRRIVSGSGDATVRIWDAERGGELAALRGHEGVVWSVSYSPDGRRIVSSAGRNVRGAHDTTVRVWDADGGNQLVVLRGHEGGVRSVSYSPDGRRIVSGAEDQTVRVWDADSRSRSVVLRGHKALVQSVSYSSDGRRIVSTAQDNTVRVWDSDSGAELTVLRGHEGWVWSVSYSSDGQRIVSGAGDATVRVWDSGSGAELAVLCGHEALVQSVSYSPDDRRIVSGAGDATVRVWDAASGAELAVLRGHEDGVSRVSYSPDGQRIASGAGDATVRVWDADRGTQLAVLRGHEKGVLSLSYSPDGQRIASGAYDNTVRVWDAKSGAELAVLHGHEASVRSVSYSPDGRSIVSRAHDRTVRVWDSVRGTCLEVIQGIGDVAAIAAGWRLFPLRALGRGPEIVIKDAPTGLPIACFPANLQMINTHPAGRAWAGSERNHIWIITLEGMIPSAQGAEETRPNSHRVPLHPPR